MAEFLTYANVRVRSKSMTFRRFLKEHHIAVDHVRTGLGSGKEVVYFPPVARAFELSATEIRVLENCLTAARPEDHAERFLSSQGLAENHRTAIQGVLGGLGEKGLIVPLSKVLGVPPGKRSGATSRGITTVAVPTCARPEMLVRLLRGFIQNTSRYGKKPRFLIIDDSRSPTDRGHNKRLLSALRVETGAKISYADRTDRLRFARALAKASGLSLQTVRDCLLGTEGMGGSYGATRNSILLETLGERVLSVDDDMTCATVPWTGQVEPGLRITGEAVKFMTHAFRSEKELTANLAASTGEDYLALHESLLGRTPFELAEEAAAGAGTLLKIDHLSAALAAKIQDRHARVAVTCTGMIGVSGTGGAADSLFIKGRQRKRFFSDADLLLSALEEDLQIRAIAQKTISDSGPTMGMNLGIDNRAIVPPFIPNLRGEDDVFGACLRIAVPGALHGYPTGTLHHGREIERRTLESTLLSSLRGSANSYLIEYLESRAADLTDGDGYARLARLGRHLEDFGARNAGETRVRLTRSDLKFLKYRRQVVEESLREPDLPPHYKAHLEKYASLIDAEALIRNTPALAGVPLMKGDAVAGFLASASRFGELLQVWETLVTSAKRLKDLGQGLAKAL